MKGLALNSYRILYENFWLDLWGVVKQSVLVIVVVPVEQEYIHIKAV